MGQNTDNPYSQQLPGSKGFNQLFGGNLGAGGGVGNAGAPAAVREPLTPPPQGLQPYNNPTGTAPLTPPPAGLRPAGQSPNLPPGAFGNFNPQAFIQQMRGLGGGDKGNGQPSSPFGLF